MSKELIAELESKLDIIIHRYHQLNEAHLATSRREAALIKKNAQLVEKTDVARARIEAMIPRMKQLETHAE